PSDITLIHLSTHQHRLGTHATIDVLSPDGASSERLVETVDWEHPSADWPPGGLALAKGQKLRITCSWHNTEDPEVRFGPLTTEMCFIIGFFYRPDESVAAAAGRGVPPVPDRRALPVRARRSERLTPIVR